MQHLIEDALRSFAAALPSGWTEAWLRVEIWTDGSGGTMAAYVTTPSAPDFVAPVSVEAEQLVPWQALWFEMAAGSDAWTSTTVALTNAGRFDLHHDYEPLGDEPPMVRHARWARSAIGDRLRSDCTSDD